MPSLIEEENQRKILADYLSKLQNPDQQKKEALGLLQQGGAPYQQAYENKFAQGGFSPESMGMAGMGAIEGVKNVGNVANATDAFLANRLKQTAKPLPTEEMGQVLGFKLPQENTIPSKRVEIDSTDFYKSHFPEISDKGAQHLSDIDNRYGDSKAVEQLMKAQKSNDPYVFPKDTVINAPIPNFNAKPTGKIGKGAPINYGEDPFMWADSKYGATKELLQKHAENGIVPEINTGSDLIAHDDYMKLIPKDAKINLYVSGIDDLSMHSRAFPGTASTKRVMSAAKKLEDNGFENVNVVPMDLNNPIVKNRINGGE